MYLLDEASKEASSPGNKKKSFGSNKAWIEQIRKEKGLSPKESETQKAKTPELAGHLVWIWDAFQFLSRTRLVFKHGPMPIPATEIVAYCAMMGIEDAEQRAHLMLCIDVLDKEYCQHQYALIAEANENQRKELERKNRRK